VDAWADQRGRTVQWRGGQRIDQSGTGYSPAAANNGDRRGLNWKSYGGWSDATAENFPDWLQINFKSWHEIGQIDVFTLQDSYANPVEPTRSLTFRDWGITAFRVQYWDTRSWIDVPGGNVTGNNLVWRTFTFPPSAPTRFASW
jgi:hypothetical protein